MTLHEMRTKIFKVTQDQMANKLGVSRRTYIRYEQGSAPQSALILAGHLLEQYHKEQSK
jgi:DNA-binding XRE family transcriptional regulator